VLFSQLTTSDERYIRHLREKYSLLLGRIHYREIWRGRGKTWICEEKGRK
jgi:hypothetical protein